MQTDSYKTKTMHVRRSARAHLLELRKARIAMRDGMMSDLGEATDQAVNTAGDPPPAPEFADRVAPKSGLDGPSNSDGADGDALDDMAVRNAAMLQPESAAPSEPSLEAASASEEVPAAAPEPAPAPEPSPQHSAQSVGDVDVNGNSDAPTSPIDAAPSPADEWQASSLAQLPGAGPGLIWIFNQCNVHSLEDLAAQDPVQLADQLGVVGQILDISQWIELAQEKSAT